MSNKKCEQCMAQGVNFLCEKCLVVKETFIHYSVFRVILTAVSSIFMILARHSFSDIADSAKPEQDQLLFQALLTDCNRQSRSCSQ